MTLSPLPSGWPEAAAAALAVASPRRRPSSPLAQVLLDACRNGPRSLDQLVSGSGAGVAPVALAVAELVRNGWLVDEAGWLEVAVSGLPP